MLSFREINHLAITFFCNFDCRVGAFHITDKHFIKRRNTLKYISKMSLCIISIYNDRYFVIHNSIDSLGFLKAGQIRSVEPYSSLVPPFEALALPITVERATQKPTLYMTVVLCHKTSLCN